MGKGVILKHPFVGYTGYRIWHKKEGHYYVCLVPRPDFSLKRTTITLAKYRLSRKLGRKLKRHEQVDHKDEYKTNDSISNLQVLTVKQNVRKNVIASGRSRPRHLKEKIKSLREKGKTFYDIGRRLGITEWQASRIHRGL